MEITRLYRQKMIFGPASAGLFDQLDRTLRDDDTYGSGDACNEDCGRYGCSAWSWVAAVDEHIGTNGRDASLILILFSWRKSAAISFASSCDVWRVASGSQSLVRWKFAASSSAAKELDCAMLATALRREGCCCGACNLLRAEASFWRMAAVRCILMRAFVVSDFMEFQSLETPVLFASIVAVLRRMADLPRRLRRLFAFLMDALLCVGSAWCAYSIRTGEWNLFGAPVLVVIAVALPAWFLIAVPAGIYRSIIRTAGGRTIADIAVACLFLSLVMLTVFSFLGVDGVPRTIGVLQPMIFLMLLATSRVVIRYALVDVLHLVHRGRQQRVAIYGAGRAGQQLGLALRHESHLVLTCYLDDDASIVGDRIDGIMIHSSTDVGRCIGELGIDEILLALPSATRARRREIVEQLKNHGVRVRSLPSIGNIIGGEVSIKDLMEVRVEDLLGRDPVPPDERLLGGAIAGKVVLVSGAGGSIGAELCRQVFARGPSCLVLVEQSEFMLYTILTELEESGAAGDDVVLVPELVDVSDAAAVRRVMQKHRPQTVFHAAAYKHVPLVEANPVSGLRNNIFGTYNCCIEAERVGTARFILVSTDKAVRPTNIMGASKRFCELVVQGRAAEGASATVFSSVRFGNVLSSSGSVVPRFQAQINAGGPVTLTHRDVTRYFMTIPEAAQLVMQAGAMAKGGEVFVLDMGQPVLIMDLARSMIQLSGCSVRDDDNPDGDILIEEVGLRPGEKMYEELLIGDNPEPTDHSRIMRAREKRLEWSELKLSLDRIALALDAGDAEAAMAVVRHVVPDYSPASLNSEDRPSERVGAVAEPGGD